MSKPSFYNGKVRIEQNAGTAHGRDDSRLTFISLGSGNYGSDASDAINLDETRALIKVLQGVVSNYEVAKADHEYADRKRIERENADRKARQEAAEKELNRGCEAVRALKLDTIFTFDSRESLGHEYIRRSGDTYGRVGRDHSNQISHMRSDWKTITVVYPEGK